MARQTRAERKARRAEQADTATTQRGRARPTAPPRQAAEIARPDAAPTPARERRGALNFIRESWGELQKVDWPGQRQVTQGTVVVLIACVIVGTYLWGADLILKRLVQNVLLGQ